MSPRSPNCAIAFTDESDGSYFDCLDSAKKLEGTATPLPGGWKMEEAINVRLKHMLAFLIGAIIAAAIRRHVGHVYGGFSRQRASHVRANCRSSRDTRVLLCAKA
jgi:hypothetical protein